MIKRLAILACLFATEAHALRQNITFRGNGSWTNLSANRIELTQITMTMSCGCQATSSFYVVNGNSTSLVQSKSGNPLNVSTWPQGTNSPTAFYLYTGDRILFRNSVTNQATGLFNGNESGGAVNNIPYVQVVGTYGISTNIQGSTGVTYVILYPSSLPPSGSSAGSASDITGTYPTNLQIVAGAVGLPEMSSAVTSLLGNIVILTDSRGFTNTGSIRISGQVDIGNSLEFDGGSSSITNGDILNIYASDLQLFGSSVVDINGGSIALRAPMDYNIDLNTKVISNGTFIGNASGLTNIRPISVVFTNSFTGGVQNVSTTDGTNFFWR